MQSLRAERIVILSAPTALEAEVRAGRIDVGLVIPDDYPAKVDSVRPVAVYVVFGSHAWRLARRFPTPARRSGALRAPGLERSPDCKGCPSGGRPTAESRGPRRLDRAGAGRGRAQVLPVFLLVSAFVMGMSLAIDTTAGERERRFDRAAAAHRRARDGDWRRQMGGGRR